MRAGTRSRLGIEIAGVAAAYTVAGKLALELADLNSSISPIWPPTGIALAALVLGGYRLWPAVAIGALLTNLNTGVPAVTVLVITVGNTLEAVVGAYLLERAGFRPSLERVRDVILLVGLAALVSTMVSATIGTAGLMAGDSLAFADLPTAWRTWWLGDAGGDLIVAPLLLIAFAYRPFARPPGRWYEAVALVAVLAALSVVVFSSSTSVKYALSPVLIWAGLRFWQPGAVFASAFVALVAILYTGNGEAPWGVTDPDSRVLLAQSFAAVAGITTLILAASTYERRRAEAAASATAETLQRSLIPGRLPQVPELDGTAYFRPAGDGLTVGGDFYDLFEVADGRWAVALGDVCGKGPSAAALTALARHTLRAASLREQLPSAALASLNEAVLRHEDPRALLTAVYASVAPNASSASLTVAVGGHPLPLVLRDDGSVEEIGAAGPMIGFDEAPAHTDHGVELRSGEAIFFYTDGLLDAYAPRRMMDVSDLQQVVAANAGGTLEHILAAIERDLLGSAGLEPRDDVAIVALRVRPGAA